MLWEATYAVNNKICQKDYGTWMKDILLGQAKGKNIPTTCNAKRELSEYDEEPASSSRCTTTVTLTRSPTAKTEHASSYAAPVTSSVAGYFPNISSSHVASESLCTKTTTLIYRSGSEESTYVEPCSICTAKTSSSSGVPEYTAYPTASSYSAGPSSEAVSTPPASEATPEYSDDSAPSTPASAPAVATSSPASPATPSSGNCGEITTTVTQRSTVYVTASQGYTAEESDDITTSEVTVELTSTIYSTTTVYMSRPISASAAPSGYENSPVNGEASSEVSASGMPSGYENSPVGAETSSSMPAAVPTSEVPSAPTYGHHHSHGAAHGHGHGAVASSMADAQGGEHGPAATSTADAQGGEHEPSSTTTVINVVTVVPVPLTSADAYPTQAPYPYGAGNGTMPGYASQSAAASASASYSVMQQTGGSSAVTVGGRMLAITMFVVALMM